VEVTASGVFLRAIAVKKGSFPYGVAERGGVIAVSLHAAHSVVLLRYDSGTVMPEVTIGSGTFGCNNGQLRSPAGVSFTTDGRYILVADCGNHRVSRFSTASGEFIAHLISNGIYCPRDVLQCEDGSIVVAQGVFGGGSEGSVVCVGEDGVTVQNISEGVFIFTPIALTYFQSLNGVVLKTFDGKVFLFRDAWMSSNRCSWLSALSCC
jgi:hypothetical protein